MRDRLAVLLLLRNVETMSGAFHRETVHALLHGEVLHLMEARRVILLNDGDESARARGVRALKPGIIFDDIRARWQRKVCERPLRIECHHREPCGFHRTA